MESTTVNGRGKHVHTSDYGHAMKRVLDAVTRDQNNPVLGINGMCRESIV